MDSIDSNMRYPRCHSVGVNGMSEQLSLAEIVWQFRYRLTRFLRRRFTYFLNQISRASRTVRASTGSEVIAASLALVAGQPVRIRSREEIRATLDSWNRLKGCSFMEEMWQYCGTNQRVLKPVRRFLDERDYRVKKAQGIVILDGVHCQGTVDYGRCDRTCFYFWREEWLVRDGLLEQRPPETSAARN